MAKKEIEVPVDESNLPVDDNDIEIVVGEEEDPDADLPDEYKTVSKAEIVARLKKAEEQVSTGAANASISQAIHDGLSKVQPAPVVIQQPQQQQRAETLDDIRKQYEEGFQTDPAGTVLKLIAEKVMPVIDLKMSGVRVVQRQQLAEGAATRANWAKYGAEIDKEVAALPPNLQAQPDAYKRAYDGVILRHIEEITDALVAKKLAEKAAQPAAPAAREPNLSETGVNQPSAVAKPVRKTLRFTEEQIAAIDKRAEAKGLSRDDYIKYAYKKGELGVNGQGTR